MIIMASSQYWKNKIDEIKKDITKYTKNFEDLVRYSNEVKPAKEQLAAVIPKYQRIGKYLENVVVAGTSYDEGYFIRCAEDFVICDKKFESLLILIRDEMNKTKEKLISLGNQLATAQRNYNSALAQEKAEAEAAAAASEANSNSSNGSNTASNPSSNSNPTQTYKGGGACFLTGTKVFTEEGTINIEDIKENDLVLTYNENTKENEIKKVLKLLVHDDKEEVLYTLTFDNYKLDVTGSHRFYIDGSWVEARNLKVDDEVMYFDKSLHRIENITNVIKKDTYYNLEIEDNHNYYVSDKGVLVHNRKMVE